MPATLKVRTFNGDWVNIELPKDNISEVLFNDDNGLTVIARAKKKDHQQQSVQVYLDERFKEPGEYYNPEVRLRIGEKTKDGLWWKWMTDAMLYTNGEKVIGKDQTHGSKYSEKTISSKTNKSEFYNQE